MLRAVVRKIHAAQPGQARLHERGVPLIPTREEWWCYCTEEVSKQASIPRMLRAAVRKIQAAQPGRAAWARRSGWPRRGEERRRFAPEHLNGHVWSHRGGRRTTFGSRIEAFQHFAPSVRVHACCLRLLCVCQKALLVVLKQEVKIIKVLTRYVV
jgi:hypothetical protein